MDGAAGNAFGVGFRNPWRFSIDSANGDFWIGDNGQDGWEEINYLKYPFEITAPNFGWSCMEGNQNYTTSHCTPGTTYQAPIVAYPGYTNNGGFNASVMGGYVYRGSRYPSLNGNYFFGDYTSGKIGYVITSGVLNFQTGLSYASLISFGEDTDADLYLLLISGGTLAPVISLDEPLPVRLVFFRLSKRENKTLFEWETAVESNFAFLSCDEASTESNSRRSGR